MIVKNVLIDVTADAVNSQGIKTDGLLLCGIKFPSAFTGTSITFDFSMDNNAWSDVVETDGTPVTYTVTAGDMVRVDPSGWAFAAPGWIRISSDGTETADRNIELVFRRS